MQFCLYCTESHYPKASIIISEITAYNIARVIQDIFTSHFFILRFPWMKIGIFQQVYVHLRNKDFPRMFLLGWNVSTRVQLHVLHGGPQCYMVYTVVRFIANRI